MTHMPLPLEQRGELVSFRVRLQPRASRDEVVGLMQGALRIRLTAPPLEGRANRRLLEFLAKLLGLPKSQVQLLKGDKSRLKTIGVKGLRPVKLRARIAEILYNE